MAAADALAADWEAHCRVVMDVAYRMLGSVTDAEDASHDVFERLAAADRGAIRDLRGWLITVTARRCLDRLRSAEVTRREYVGPWLPEPVVNVADTTADPADRVTLDESVRMALLAVLERLSPAERTAFVLHDVFAMPFSEVSVLVGRTVPACRQLARRAREHIREADRRFDVDPANHRRLAERFAAACNAGDLAALLAVLDPDVTGEFDSGGVLPAAPRAPVRGAERVAQLLLRSFQGLPVHFQVGAVNAEPGLVVLLEGRVVTVLTFQTAAARIRHIQAIGNPAKLRRVSAPSPGA